MFTGVQSYRDLLYPDDFCKEFASRQKKYMIEDKKNRHQGKPDSMSDAEIMLILILFHSGGFRHFKHYYKEYVCKHLSHLFPKLVSYNRFVELEKDMSAATNGYATKLKQATFRLDRIC